MEVTGEKNEENLNKFGDNKVNKNKALEQTNLEINFHNSFEKVGK